MMPHDRHVISLAAPYSMPYAYPSPLTALERTPQGHQERTCYTFWPRTGALISELTTMRFLRHWGTSCSSHPNSEPNLTVKKELSAGFVVFSGTVNEGSP